MIVLFGTVLGVRVIGAAADGSMAASVHLIIPEIVFLVVTSATIAFGARAERANR